MNKYSEYSPYSYQKFEKQINIDKQKMLYLSIGIIILFIVILYAVDYMMSLLKPEFARINGKFDRSRHFSYTIGISFVIYIAVIFVLYQFFA